METRTTKVRLSTALLIFSLLLVPFIQSCKKYPDGPAFSVRSKKERIANEWKLENYTINDRDFNDLDSNYTEAFTKNSGYAYWWGSRSGSGNWSFQNNDKEIRLSGFDFQSSRTLVILKLEEKNFCIIIWLVVISTNFI